MFSSPSYVGVDAGSESIKIVELSRKGKQHILKGCGVFPLSDLTAKIFQETLHVAFKSLKIKAKEIAISVPGQYSIVRYLDFPKMPPAQLQEALRFEASKYIPYALDATIYDYAVLSDNDPKATMQRILLAAVKKEVVFQRLKLFEDAGFMVKLVDVSSFSLLNLFLNALGKDWAEEGAVALLNLGHSYTDIIIIARTVPCFTRTIQVGARHFDEIIAAAFGVGADEARKTRQSSSLSDQKIATVVDTVQGKLAKEVKLSFDFYENQSGQQITKMYLAGGMSYDTAFCEAFAQSLGAKLQHWNVMAHIIYGPAVNKAAVESNANQLAVAAGLALRKI